MNEVKRKIGGTMLSKILGLSRWGGPMDAYLSLTGIVEDNVESDAAWSGKAMQEAILKRYNKEASRDMMMCDITYAHPIYDFITWTPDCLESKFFAKWPKSDHIVELKQTSVREQYGAPGTDEVSEETGIQCQLYMGCCEAKTCDVAVHFLRPRHEFAIYHLEFNQEIFNNIIQAARDFWENHVLPQIPPPIDASEGSKKLLNYLYPRETEDLLQSVPEIEKIAEILKKQEESRDLIIQDLTYTQNLLKEIIGDHAGIQTSLGKVTWKRSKDREQVDWKAAFDQFHKRLIQRMDSFNRITVSDEADKAVQDFTKIIPGSRVFRTYFKRED